jgi:iron(III) transport system substrate-binding protein
LPQWAIWKNEAYGVTAEPIVMAYNKRLIPAAEVPHTHTALEQLLRTNPKYMGRVASYDPETSGTGFLYLTQDAQATRETWRLVRAMGQAKLQLFTSTDAMLKCVGSGECLIAYNVVGSYALGQQQSDPSLGVVLPRDYTLVTSRIALITAEARHPDAAKLFLDYLLSKRGQTQLANRHMTPIRADVARPAGVRAAENRERAIRVGPELLANLDQIKRQRFLKNWRRAIGRT